MHPDSATSRTDAFAWTLAADPSSVSAARQAFITWLAGLSTDEELLEDMAVVVSELACNAVDGADPDAPIAEVRAAVEDEVINLTVSNELPDGVGDIRKYDLDDSLRDGGRGLMIVRAYTDSLRVDSTGGTVIVRCTRRLTPDP